MDIQASIVINWPAEAVFAYLASEEHIAVLGQQVEYEQEASEGSPEESRLQGEMKGEGKRRPYIYIPIMINPPNAQFQEMRRVSEGEPGRGSAFVQVYTRGDRTFETSVVISVYEPARMLAFTISGQPFLPWNREDQAPPIPAGFVFNREPIWLSYILIPLANGTRLTCTVSIVDPKGGFYRLLSELLFTKALDKGLKEDLGRLKDLLEGRPVPPRQRLTIRGPFKLDVGASIVIKRPIEAVFAYISEIKPTRITPEMQQERVERVSRRFLGIFPYTEVHQHPAVKEIRQEPEGPIGVGTRFVEIKTWRGDTSEDTTEITEYEPPRIIAFKVSTNRPYRGKSEAGVPAFERGPVEMRGPATGQGEQLATFFHGKMVLEPVAGGTLVTETMYSDEGCYKLIAPFVAPDMRRQLQKGLREMKEESEAERD